MKKKIPKVNCTKCRAIEEEKSVKWQLLSWFKCNRKIKQTSKQKKYSPFAFLFDECFYIGSYLPPRGSFKMFEYTLLWQIEGAIGQPLTTKNYAAQMLILIKKPLLGNSIFFKNKLIVYIIFCLSAICRKELEQMWKILEVCWKDNQVGLANIQNLDPSTTFWRLDPF